MVVSKLKPTFSLEQDLLEGLKQLIPEAISESKINWELLKEVLGEHLEEEGSEIEHFGLNWAGKRQARRLASLPSKGTLVPVLGEGIDEENTGNIFIEGNNLEVLKLLQKSYVNRVKLIYIDPPYNTGKDFIYKDNFSELKEDYLKRTGQVDEDGNLLTSNPKSGGRYHSNWLNMMYPRLRLARNLLREDGVIFISIDDNEVSNLKKICDEIFGEENFIANVIWQRAFAPKNDAKYLSNSHDHLLIFGKQIDEFEVGMLNRTEEANARYKNLDNDPRGLWISDNLTVKTYSQKNDYPVTTPSGRVVNPTHGRCWGVSKGKMNELISDNRIWFGENNSNVPRLKRFLSDVKNGMVATTLWLHNEVGHNQEGRQELKNLFDDKGIFDGPKPIRFLKRILKIANCQENDLVIDFFAGSCSTAHAVMDWSIVEKNKLQFIMIQVPETIVENSEAYKEGYKNIAEIGKERIRRAIKKIQEEQQNRLELNGEKEQDLGFKVYKLDKSNLKIWENHQNNDLKAFQDSLFDFENPLIDGWKEEDVVTEIQLIEGFPLDSKIEKADIFTRNRVLEVASDLIGHKLFICLENQLKLETIEQVKSLASEDIFICLDNALTDEAKLQLADSCNVKAL